MEATLAALIAVLGTLVGAVATYAFQRRERAHTERRELMRERRQERLAAYAAFADAISAFRGCEVNRIEVRLERGRESAEYQQIKAESIRLRAVARGAMFQVRLLAPPALAALSAAAMATTSNIRSAENPHGALRERADQAHAAIEEFVAAAAVELSESPR